MRPAIIALLLLPALAVQPAFAKGRTKAGHAGFVLLNGVRTGVHWSDGDSFKFTAGPHARKGTRLAGYNALESYGPVHRWGEWTAQELLEIAKGSAAVAAAQEWACLWSGKVDGYGRMLVDCRDLTREMLRRGHGMLFAVGEDADPELLALQREAQKAKAGMWAKGAPALLITSAHSKADGKGYNRVLDMATGRAEEVLHSQNYATCQEVCVGAGRQASCLTYVPFENRYKPRSKPDCLKAKPTSGP